MTVFPFNKCVFQAVTVLLSRNLPNFQLLKKKTGLATALVFCFSVAIKMPFLQPVTVTKSD